MRTEAKFKRQSIQSPSRGLNNDQNSQGHLAEDCGANFSPSRPNKSNQNLDGSAQELQTISYAMYGLQSQMIGYQGAINTQSEQSKEDGRTWENGFMT